MQFIKLFFGSMLLLLWITCSSRENCCTVIDSDVNIKYLDENNHSLFSENPAYLQENVDLYYKDGTSYKKFYNSNASHPKNYLFYENENGETVTRIFPSDIYEGNFSTTLIALNEYIVDTMVCEFEFMPSREFCKNVWYNGILMKGKDFEITKK